MREENLAASLRPKTRLEIETVVDPTLLVDKSVWEKTAEPPPVDGKYVLVYQVSHNPAADAYARDLAAQLGAKVVSVWAGYSLRRGMLRTETPEQFVGWFKNAACVVSTSFHGTAFSLIFGRPLYYVGSGQPGENRPKQILRALGLESRYLLSGSPCPEFSEIDYDDVNKMGGGYSCVAGAFPRVPGAGAFAAENAVAFPRVSVSGRKLKARRALRRGGLFRVPAACTFPREERRAA